MRIYWKLVIVFLALAIIPILFVSRVTFYNAKANLEKEIFSRINNTADQKVEEIETFFAERRYDLIVIEQDDVFGTNVGTLDKFSADRSNPYYVEAKKALDLQLGMYQKAYRYVDIMIMNMDGKTVYALNPAHAFEPNTYVPDRNEALRRVRTGVYFGDAHATGAKEVPFTMSMAAAIHDSKSEMIGMIYVEIDMEAIFKLMQSAPGSANSWEMLLVRKVDGNKVIYLSSLRRDLNAILRKTITIGDSYGIPAQRAASGETGSGVSIDYAGKRVLSAWRPVPLTGWGLVVKVDVKEAFLPIEKLKKVLIAVLLVVILSILAAVFTIAKSIADPINELHRGAEIIGNGNLDYKVGTDTHDEIGQLSRAFDEMTEHLKARTTSIDNLNREIVERKRVEAALRDSEETYRALFNESKDAMMTLSLDGEFITGNPEAIKMFGCRDEKDFQSRTPDELSPEYQPDGALSKDKVHQMIMLTVEKGSHFFEWMHKKLDGTEFPATVLLSRVEKGGKTIIQATVRDITERKRAERVLEKAYKELKDTQADLIQSEKMSALGRFSACIAHEVKNPLGIILGGLEFLESKLPHDDENVEKAFMVTKDSVLRANTILESFLQYSRPAVSKNEVIDASNIVNFILEMIKVRARMSSITIQTEFSPGLLVSVDKNQMNQALLNIAINAMDAMPKGGSISFKTYKAIEPKLSEEKESCVIEVSDTGGGISQKHLSRLAEPFFTTKKSGVGTGLGIFVTKTIIDNHKGALSIESIQGKGTIVKMILPLVSS